MKRFVAVVTKNDFTSARQLGDWACFVSDKKRDAIDRALKARTRWESNGQYGPYKIWVGVLNEEVIVPTAYELQPIEDD